MSTINTNNIDVNYPIPGQNNSSQGFRNNFTAIKTNLNIASSEISDLQNKAVLKQALVDNVIDNDMGNTLISNASTLGFRATTYNLGNDLSGVVLIDLSLGDVQYGNVAANSNITVQFGNWAPSGTQSNVQLVLGFADSNSFVNFPTEVVQANNNFGVTTLENYANVASVPTVSAPYGVTELCYRLSSLDCGTTIFIEPSNRPRIATQVQTRTPTNKGQKGDVAGTMCADTSYLYVCTGTYNGSTNIWKRITLNSF